VIFIGGVHGVGKSFFCDQVFTKLDLKSYSASNLISELKNEQFTMDKRIKDIDDNQDYLLEAVKRLVITEGEFLLDGHFCLLNSNGKVQRIPPSTFKQLSPQAIIVLYDTVETIASRLNKRDGVHYKLTNIDAFQQEELVFSREISIALNIPFLAINNTSCLDEVYTFIVKHKA